MIAAILQILDKYNVFDTLVVRFEYQFLKWFKCDNLKCSDEYPKYLLSVRDFFFSFSVWTHFLSRAIAKEVFGIFITAL